MCRHCRRPLPISNIINATPSPTVPTRNGITEDDGSPPDINAHSRQVVDTEIQKLEEQIRLLKTNRNALARISRLPPELLSNIFKCYALSLESTSSRSIFWIKVTHVCQHWRTVALGCPSLWSTIPLQHYRNGVVTEFLKRSKMAPLNISIVLPYGPFERFTDVLKQMSRIAHLSLITSGHDLDRLKEHMHQSAPALRSLQLDNASHYSFSPMFLQGNAPKLEEITLVRCAIPWDSTLFSNLRILKLWNVQVDVRPTWSQLFNLLGNTNRLVELDLTECLPVVHDANILSYPVIDLSCLNRLHLSGKTQECANILDRITIPMGTALKVFSQGERLEDLTRLSSSLTSHIRAATNQVIKRLHLDISSSANLHLNAFTSPVSSTAPAVEVDYSLTIPIPTSVLVNTICSSLPLSELTDLTMAQTYVFFPAGAIVSNFGLLPKLKEIIINGDTIAELATALIEVDQTPVQKALRRSTRKNKGSSSVVQPLQFPALSSVTLVNVDFGSDPDASFAHSLKVRRKRKQGLHKLQLQRCLHLREDQVEMLEKHVKSLDWDEEILGFTSEEEEDMYDSYDGPYYDSDDDDLYGYGPVFYF